MLAVGWLLGGNVGLGTLVYAAAIGPLVHVTIPRLKLGPAYRSRVLSRAVSAGRSAQGDAAQRGQRRATPARAGGASPADARAPLRSSGTATSQSVPEPLPGLR